MQALDIVLGFGCTVVAITGILLLFVYRTAAELHRNAQIRIAQALENQDTKGDYTTLSTSVTDLNRELLVLQAGQESLSLRVTDLTDTLEARFNRLRMRNRRAAQEEEEAAPVLPEEEAQLLLEQFSNGEEEVEQQPAGRRRLVRKTGRRRRY